MKKNKIISIMLSFVLMFSLFTGITTTNAEETTDTDDVQLIIDGTLYSTYSTIQDAVDYLKTLVTYEVTDQADSATKYGYTSANINYGYESAEIRFTGTHQEDVDVTKSFTDAQWKVSTSSSCTYVVPMSNITFNGCEEGVLNGKFILNGNNITIEGIHFIGNFNQKWSYYSTDSAIVIKGDAGLTNSNRIVSQTTIDAGSAYVTDPGDYRNIIYTNNNIIVSNNEFEGYSFVSNFGVYGGTVSSLYFDNNNVHDCMFLFHTSDADAVTLSITNNELTGTSDSLLASCVAATKLTDFSNNSLTYTGFGLQNCETDIEQFLNNNTYDHGYIYQETVDYSWTNESLSNPYYYLPSSTTVMTVLPDDVAYAVWTSSAGAIEGYTTYTQQDAIDDAVAVSEDKTYSTLTWTGGGTDEDGNVLDGGVAIGYNYTATQLDYVYKGTLTINKEIAGDDIDTIDTLDISFVVTDESEEVAATISYSDFENGSYSLKLAPGTYTVTEITSDIDNYITSTTIDDEEIQSITIEISESEETTVNFTNTYTALVDITVTKEWDDNDSADRPTGVNVTLYADGEEVETVTLSDENNWTYTFEDLPKYADGEEIEYTVGEEAIDGYTSVITGSVSEDFVITNTLEETETSTSTDPSSSDDTSSTDTTVETTNTTTSDDTTTEAVETTVQTGDMTQMSLWIALLFVSGCGIFIYRKRKNLLKR
ncbi:MAG: Cna B-type domain-containing protein [Erysipelotrichaceae bacterium]|nr:Cna B-type domain-containing protein [Erysipelotrichaceae bacterium]